jgi:hypothetical protein
MARARRGRGRGHLIADPRLATAAGLGAMVLAAVLLHDAYEGRARDQPFWLRPFSFW